MQILHWNIIIISLRIVLVDCSPLTLFQVVWETEEDKAPVHQGQIYIWNGRLQKCATAPTNVKVASLQLRRTQSYFRSKIDIADYQKSWTHWKAASCTDKKPDM